MHRGDIGKRRPLSKLIFGDSDDSSNGSSSDGEKRDERASKTSTLVLPFIEQKSENKIKKRRSSISLLREDSDSSDDDNNSSIPVPKTTTKKDEGQVTVELLQPRSSITAADSKCTNVAIISIGDEDNLSKQNQEASCNYFPIFLPRKERGVAVGTGSSTFELAPLMADPRVVLSEEDTKPNSTAETKEEGQVSAELLQLCSTSIITATSSKYDTDIIVLDNDDAFSNKENNQQQRIRDKTNQITSAISAGSTSGAITTPSNKEQAASRGDDWRGVAICGWVSQPERGVNAVTFVRANLPSSWGGGVNSSSSSNAHWLSILRTVKPSESSSPSLSSCMRNPWVGKWLWFVDPADRDSCFLSVARALEDGRLGHSAKIAIKPMGGRHVICIYTENFMDAEDALRVGREVRKLGALSTISYKPDVFTLSNDGIYGKNTIPKSIYQIKRGETCLTYTMSRGKRDVSVAEEMSLREIAEI